MAEADYSIRSEQVLFKFLEQYLRRLEGPLAIQVWGRLHQLAKDVAGSTKELKPLTLPALRCVTVLAEKVTQTTAMEDRRIRKELQVSPSEIFEETPPITALRKSTENSWILVSPSWGKRTIQGPGSGEQPKRHLQRMAEILQPPVEVHNTI